MGKRRFNEKGRQQNETVIDNTATKQIKLDFSAQEEGYGGSDDANMLVLPSKKRPTKIKQDKTVVTKILSKKQRKRLEKIVDQKRKKENRSTLISALSDVQATSEELKNYTKLSAVQTKGLKQLFKEQKFGVISIDKPVGKVDSQDDGHRKLKSLVGMRKQRLALLRAQQQTEDDEDKGQKDLNTIGLEEESSSSEEEAESEISVDSPRKEEEKMCEKVKMCDDNVVPLKKPDVEIIANDNAVQAKPPPKKATESIAIKRVAWISGSRST